MSAAEGGGVFVLLCDTAARRSLPLRVNVGMQGAGQNPAVCFDRLNRLTIVWEQWGPSAARVLVAQYAADGTMLAPTQCAADDSTVNAQTPRLALNPDGQCAVVWLDYRRGSGAVFLQRFLPGLRKKQKNVLVAESDFVLQTPVVSLDVNGRAACAWQAAMHDSFHVVLRVCDRNGRWLPAAIVDEGVGKAYASTPDIAALPRGGSAVVWKDYRTGESDIYLQLMNAQGKKIGPNLRVNDDTTRRWQRLPKVVVSASVMLVVWEDYRNDPGNQIGDIYAQRLSAKGIVIGTNSKVNHGPEPSIQRFPAAAMNRAGSFAIVWDDNSTAASSLWLLTSFGGDHRDGRERQIVP
ncbi:MAG: hypothetical protein WCQ44_08075 [Opitutaceae bacterium]